MMWFCLFRLDNSVFCCSTWDSYTTEQLETTAADLLPTYLASSLKLLDVAVKGVPTLGQVMKCRWRGEKTTVCLCNANVSSLCKELEELELLVEGKQRHFLVFHQRRLCFRVVVVGFDIELSKRKWNNNVKGGGIWLSFTNDSWCSNLTVIM